MDLKGISINAKTKIRRIIKRNIFFFYLMLKGFAHLLQKCILIKAYKVSKTDFLRDFTLTCVSLNVASYTERGKIVKEKVVIVLIKLN